MFKSPRATTNPPIRYSFRKTRKQHLPQPLTSRPVTHYNPNEMPNTIRRGIALETIMRFRSAPEPLLPALVIILLIATALPGQPTGAAAPPNQAMPVRWGFYITYNPN